MVSSESEDDLFDSDPLLESQISKEINSLKIKVNTPERRINENSGGIRDDIYTSYQVESANNEKIHRVGRRYNQFLLLVSPCLISNG